MKLSWFEKILEIWGWFRIFTSPTMIGLILGVIAYNISPNIIGLMIGMIFLIIGIILGIIWANKIYRSKKGTIHYIYTHSHIDENNNNVSS